MQRLKWTLKFIGKIAIVLIVLFLLCYVLIQLPKVQTWLVQKAATSLSKKLDTKVAIESVNIEFFKTAVLEGILIEDQKRDTLLYADQLKVNIGIFSAFQKEISIQQVALNGALVQLSRMEQDSLFNYEFLLGNNKTSTETTIPDTTSTNSDWNISLSNVLLENTRFNMIDRHLDGFELMTTIKQLCVQTDGIDASNKKIHLEKLLLEKSKVSYILLKESDKSEKVDKPLAFPNLGWEIVADQVVLLDNQIKYADSNVKEEPDVVNFTHLDLKDVSLVVNELELKEQQITGDIRNLKLIDKSGFQINKLNGQVALTDENITVNALTLQTPLTNLDSELSFSFVKFDDLKDFSNKVKTVATISPSQVAYEDLWKLIPAFRDIPSMRTDLSEQINIDGKIIFENDQLTLRDLDAKIGDNFLLQADGSIRQLSKKPYFDLSLQKVESNYAAITSLTKDFTFPIGFEKFGQINLSGDFKGTVEDLVGTNCLLTTSGETQFQGDIALKGLPDVDKLQFSARIDNLTTQAEEIRGFSKSPLPTFLDTLGVSSFQGEFAGTLLDFEVNGDFQTSKGDLTTNLDLNFKSDYASAAYGGELNLEDFDLAPILGKDFGKVSFKGELKGDGFKLDDLDTSLDAIIPSIVYQDYTYKNLKIDGSFFKKKFDGKANIQDENIAFDFFGNVDLNDSLPIMNIVMQVDTINLKRLNLSEKQMGMSGLITADLVGDELDNMKGRLGINQFKITQDGRSYATEKKVYLKVHEKKGTDKKLTFRSEFMNAKVEGDFVYKEFTNNLISFIGEFFSIDDLIGRSTDMDIAQTTPVKQVFDFDFKFKDIAAFTQVFVPALSEIDTAYLKGNFNNITKELQFDGMFPDVKYAGFAVDTLHLMASTNKDVLDIDFLCINGGSGSLLGFPYGELKATAANDSLHLNFDIWDEVIAEADTVRNQKLLMGGVVTEMQKVFDLSLMPSITLNDRIWEIDQKNKFTFKSNDLFISDLGLIKDQQSVYVNSVGEAPANDFAPLAINFQNFDLREISNLLGLEDAKLLGSMNGNVALIEPMNNLHYTAELSVDSLTLNQEKLGLLKVAIVQENNSDKIDVDVVLSEDNDAKIYGTYDLVNNAFDLDLDFKKLSVAIFDPFVKQIIQNSSGYVEGMLKLEGSPKAPAVNGTLNAKEWSTLVSLSNTAYSADYLPIVISEKQIRLDNISLKDPSGNLASLDGKINHDYFQNLNLDLLFRTDEFQILNTTVEDNELYHGNLFVKAEAKIDGPLELPHLDVSATTLPQTELSVQPFLETHITEQEDYIIFANPATYNADSLLQIEKSISQNTYPFDLALNLEVTEDAVLNVLIDPETGDNLQSIGTANLGIGINPKGDISVVGDYIIDNGKYSMNYEQLIKREFDIKKGSQLVFSGDPLKATFNVSAIYKVRTTLQDLISIEATDEEINSASYRQDVNVVLKINGSLESPVITFDIEVPDSQASAVNSPIANRLSALRNSPNELNTQVFGLLFFNAFVVSNQGFASSISNAPENIALSSVSKLVSGQLNKLADRFIKGVEVNLDLESYKSGLLNDETVTQFQVQLSKKFINDRLTIKVGTNVNLDSVDSNSDQSGFSNIAGDFILEYKLTESGNYFISVFHKSDVNILEDANTSKSGAGFIYRKSFNGKKYKN